MIADRGLRRAAATRGRCCSRRCDTPIAMREQQPQPDVDDEQPVGVEPASENGESSWTE